MKYKLYRIVTELPEITSLLLISTISMLPDGKSLEVSQAVQVTNQLLNLWVNFVDQNHEISPLKLFPSNYV